MNVELEEEKMSITDAEIGGLVDSFARAAFDGNAALVHRCRSVPALRTGQLG